MSDGGESGQNGGGLAQARAAPSAFPSNYRPIVWEGFETLNMKAPRAAIQDAEVAWCDGWMPIAPGVTRILPDVGASKFTATGANVVWLGFGNIGDTNYGVVVQTDGAVHMFDTSTGARFQIMGAGVITAPSGIFGFSQWGTKYLLFSKDQDNGYWLWNGSNLFTAGTLDPEIELTNSGTNYTSAPTVTAQTTGTGVAPGFTAKVNNQSVVEIVCNAPGSGFAVDDFVALNITGGGSDDQALPDIPTVHTDWGGFKTVIIFDGGSKYTARAFGVISGGGQDPAGEPAEVSLSISNGTITAVGITRKGSGYTSAPTLVVSDPGIPGTPAIPGGTGFSAQVQIEYGQIGAIGLLFAGSGYLSPPSVKIIGDGTGAAAYADVQSGQVISIRMTDFGSGYSKALAILEGGNNAANATASVFPWGISGTAIETYQSRVWVSNGAAAASFPPKSRVIYSDPETPTGFGNGGGAFKSNDSFLRVGFHWLRQTNGFLYLGADSSTNYLSGVSTAAASAAGPPVTTFSNNNVDPQIGSPWPSSVQVFSRNIVLANPQGIYVSYGGSMTKISTPIDPLYQSCPTLNAPGANFSSAVAQIFNTPVYMLLMPVIDIVSGNLVNKLLMWDGKRLFTSQQSRALAFVAAQEINSNLTAWGTDGTDVFPLFQQPSILFNKNIISKLYSFGYFMTKTFVRLQGVTQAYVIDEAFDIALDSSDPANVPSPAYAITPGIGGSWFGAGGAVGSWTGTGGTTGPWNVTGGLGIFGPIPVGQWGRMLGFTVTTAASDMALLSILGEAQDFAANV